MANLLTCRGVTRLRDERGFGVVTALMVASVVFVTAGLWTQIAIHQTQRSAVERNREQAFAAAEAGLNDAMARLARDAQNCTDYTLDVNGDSKIDVEVIFDTPASCADEAVTSRYLIARGYAPHRDSPRVQRRQIEQQIELVPATGFTYAMFTAPGGIAGSNKSDIIGDVYSDSDLDLANLSVVKGNVIGMESVTLSNGTTVTGTVHTAGDVALNHAGATVEGDVISSGGQKPDGTWWSGNISTKGAIKGNSRAKGSITIQTGGSIDGERAPNSSPPHPVSRSLPTFTPTDLTYDATWGSAAALYSYWDGLSSAFSGYHRVQGTSVGTLTLDKNWSMAGNAAIVSDGPVALTRQVSVGGSGNRTLAVISLSSATDAITVSHNGALDADVKVLLFAPNGCVKFQNLKDFHGTVYAKCVTLDQNFKLTYEAVDFPGFTWTTSSATQFTIESRSFREVRFTG